jgi:hypothetical protein
MRKFKDRMIECLEVAGDTYGGILTTPSASEILLNMEYMNGNTIAHATFDNRYKMTKHIISLNTNYIEEHEDMYLSDVIPHEVSHTICFDNGIDDVHGELWMELCVLMGGSGEEFIKLEKD